LRWRFCRPGGSKNGCMTTSNAKFRRFVAVETHHDFVMKRGLSLGFERTNSRPLRSFRSFRPRKEIVKPLGGVRPFHQKSTCLTQSTLGPNVVQIWSHNTLKLRGNETLELHRVFGVGAYHTRTRTSLITEFIKDDSPFCLAHAISRTMNSPCPRSVLVPTDASRRCARMK